MHTCRLVPSASLHVDRAEHPFAYRCCCLRVACSFPERERDSQPATFVSDQVHTAYKPTDASGWSYPNRKHQSACAFYNDCTAPDDPCADHSVQTSRSATHTLGLFLAADVTRLVAAIALSRGASCPDPLTAPVPLGCVYPPTASPGDVAPLVPLWFVAGARLSVWPPVRRGCRRNTRPRVFPPGNRA